MNQATALGLAVAVATIAAVTDLRSGRIPNLLTGLGLVLGLGIHAASGAAGAASGAAGAVIAFLLPAALHRVSRGDAIGGGDVKLFAALGALLGPTRALEVEFLAFVGVTVFALTRLAYQGLLLRVVVNSARLLAGALFPSLRASTPTAPLAAVRMGPSILLAVCAAAASDWLGGSLPWVG